MVTFDLQVQVGASPGPLGDRKGLVKPKNRKGKLPGASPSSSAGVFGNGKEVQESTCLE